MNQGLGCSEVSAQSMPPSLMCSDELKEQADNCLHWPFWTAGSHPQTLSTTIKSTSTIQANRWSLSMVRCPGTSSLVTPSHWLRVLSLTQPCQAFPDPSLYTLLTQPKLITSLPSALMKTKLLKEQLSRHR